MTTRNARDASAGPVQGTQVIDRAVALMRLIASEGANGARLTDLARGADLHQPTARRILKRLADHAMVAQDAQTQRYHLGNLAYEFGLSAAHRVSLPPVMKPVLQSMAQASGDTAYLVMRSGADVICIDRVEGGYPIKTLTLQVGQRIPIGVSAGGLALLASLPDGDVDALIKANAADFPERGEVSLARLKSDVRDTRKRGYALRHSAITTGVVGLGMAVPNGGMPPFAAVSLAMIAARAGEERLGELVDLMRAALKRLPGA